MKKIFALLLTVSSITVAVAQPRQGSYSRNDNRAEDKRYEGSYSFTAREKDEQVARINQQFNAQIRDIKFDRYLKENKKRKQIERLEFQRSQQIAAVNARYADRRNRFGGSYAYNRH